MNKNILILVISCLVFAGAGFYGGTIYQSSKNPANQFGNRGTRPSGQFNPQMGRQGFRPVNGEVITADSKTISVKLADGSSKLVLLNDKTEINKAEKGTLEEIKVGIKVAIFGTDNADGSVTAQNVQLNPIAREMMSPTPSK